MTQALRFQKLNQRTGYRLGLLALCLLALALRLYLLEDIAWHEDEAKSQFLYNQQSVYTILTHYHPNNHWLSNLFGYLLGRLGEQRFFLRWPSTLFGTLAVPLMGVAGYRLFQDRRDGLLAALLLCLSAFHVRWSQQFRGYSGLLFFALLSFLLLQQALRTGRRVYWWGVVGSMLLTLASHLYGVLMLAVMVAILVSWLWRQPAARAKDRPQPQGAWLVCLVALALISYSTWFGKIYIINFYHRPPEGNLLQLIYYQWLALVPTLPEISKFFKAIALAFTAQMNESLALILFGGLSLAGLTLSWPRAPRSTFCLVVWLLLPLVGVIVAEFAIAGFFVFNRFLIFILPAWLLLAVRGLTLGSNWLAGRFTSGGWFQALLFLSLTGAGLGYLSWPNFYGMRAYFVDQAGHDWRGVAAYLAGHAEPADVIVCNRLLHRSPPRPGDEDQCLAELNHRLAGSSRLAGTGWEIVTADQLDGVRQRRGDQPGAVWFVIWGVEAPLCAPGTMTFDRLGYTTLLEADTGSTLAVNLDQATAALVDLAASFIDPAGPVNADFGEPPAIRLSGYTLPTISQAGQTVPVTLFWQALEATPVDYTIFLHLRNSSGQTVSQLDFRPFDGAYSTSAWTPGAIIEETRQWPLPADLPPGPYTLQVGLYQVQTLSRLFLVEDRSGENALALEEMWVK